MSHLLPSPGYLDRGARLLMGFACLLAAPWAAAQAGPDPASRLQRTMVQAVEAWRGSAFVAANKPLGVTDQEIRLAREIQLVVAPAAKPLLRLQSRLEGPVLIVSVGWLSLVEDLLRAEALGKTNSTCVDQFAKYVEAQLREAQRIEATPPPPPPPLPHKPGMTLRRLDAWLPGEPACDKVSQGQLRLPAVQAEVEQGLATIVVGLLSAQVVQQAAQRPAPAASSPKVKPGPWYADAVLASYGLSAPAAWGQLVGLSPLFDEKTRAVMQAWSSAGTR